MSPVLVSWLCWIAWALNAIVSGIRWACHDYAGAVYSFVLSMFMSLCAIYWIQINSDSHDEL